MKSTVPKIFLMGLAWLALSCGPPQGGVETTRKTGGGTTSIQAPGSGGSGGTTTPTSYKIMFESRELSATSSYISHLKTMNFDGSNVETLISGSDFPDLIASEASPNGQYIAFLSQKVDKNSTSLDTKLHLWIYDRQNKIFSRLTNLDNIFCQIYSGFSGDPNRCLSWSSDNSEIVFVVGSTPDRKIYKVSISAPLQPSIISSQPTADNIDPYFSPQGKRIVFISMYDNRTKSELWLRDEQGNFTSLIPKGDYIASPIWSPDGSKIAFTQGLNGVSAKTKYIVLQTKAVSVIGSTQSAIGDFTPDWSPDNKRVVFTSFDPNGNHNDSRQVNYFDFSTNQTQGLVNPNWEPGRCADPHWLNNDEVIYLSDTTGNSSLNLYSVKIQQQPRRLTTNFINLLPRILKY